MRTRSIAVVFGAVALTGWGWSSTVASAGSGDADLVVIAKTVSETELDLGEEGLTQGDQFVFADELFDEDGKKLGRDGGVCVVTEPPAHHHDAGGEMQAQHEGEDHAAVHPEPESLLCTASVVLPDGKITVSGLATAEEFAEGLTMPVTGGTGKYRGARGEVGIEFSDDGKDSTLTFHFD